MESKNWMSDIENAKKSCIVQNKLKKVHYLFPNGREMVEEYNMETEVLTRRAWKLKTELGGDEGLWDIEIGDPEPKALNSDVLVIAESNTQPVVSRRMTKRNLEWRIRNLPYPIEVYSIIADPENKCIVVKTSNKKYYKKLEVPDLTRLRLNIQQTNIEFTHKFNTLIITYKKPTELLEAEKLIMNEVKKIQPNPMTNDVNNCKAS